MQKAKGKRTKDKFKDKNSKIINEELNNEKFHD